MNNVRPFQLVLWIGSIFVMVAALIAVSLYQPGDEGLTAVPFPPNFQIWGTFEEEPFMVALDKSADNDERFANVQYVQLGEDVFVDQLINAIAEERGPDLIVLPHDQLVDLREKLFPLSYDFYFPREFDKFVEGSSIFMRSNGTYAIPFAVDPLVMYWNRDIFSSNSTPLPPKTWEELRNDTVPTLTRLGGGRSLIQSGVAFGEYSNVRNATEVLSLLMIQSGSQMVTENDSGYRIALNQTAGDLQSKPADGALSFYTEFSNPTSQLFSWNRSLPNDRSHFLAGNLAVYFGYSSEYDEMLKINPNLNFDMAPVPQGATARALRGYGRFYGFAIPLRTRDSGSSWKVAQVLGSSQLAADLAEEFNMAPVDRAILAASQPDKIKSIRNEAAQIARGWLAPEPSVLDRAFRDMVEDVTSGRSSVSESLAKAQQLLELGY